MRVLKNVLRNLILNRERGQTNENNLNFGSSNCAVYGLNEGFRGTERLYRTIQDSCFRKSKK